MKNILLCLCGLLFLSVNVMASNSYYVHNVTYANNGESIVNGNISCMAINLTLVGGSCNDIADFETCVNSYTDFGEDEKYNCEWNQGCFLFARNKCTVREGIYVDGLVAAATNDWFNDSCNYNITLGLFMGGHQSDLVGSSITHIQELYSGGIQTNQTNHIINESRGYTFDYIDVSLAFFVGSCESVNNLNITSIYLVSKLGGSGEFCSPVFQDMPAGYNLATFNCLENNTNSSMSEIYNTTTTIPTTSTSSTTLPSTTTTTGGGTTTAPSGGGTPPNAWPTAPTYPNVGAGTLPSLNGGTIPGGAGGMANTTGLGAIVLGVQTTDFLKWAASAVVLGALLLSASNLSLGVGLSLVLLDFFVLVLPWLTGFPLSLLLYVHFIGLSTFFISRK